MTKGSGADSSTGIDVLGRVVSGIYIMTCVGAQQNHGLLASWVMQAGFTPPSITVAVKQDRPIMRDLKPGTIFCINVLANDEAGKKYMSHFGKGFGIGTDAFAGIETQRAAAGGHYLPGALGYMECRVMRLLEPSTEHNLIAAEITSGAMLKAGEPWVHIRKSGSGY